MTDKKLKYSINYCEYLTQKSVHKNIFFLFNTPGIFKWVGSIVLHSGQIGDSIPDSHTHWFIPPILHYL